MENVALSHKQKQKKFKQHQLVQFFVVLALLFAAGLIYLDISVLDLLSAVPMFLQFFVENFLPPDFSGWSIILKDLFDTVIYAFIATIFSTFLAFGLGLLISKNTNSYKPLRIVARAIVSLFRNIPVVIWASLFVYVFGIGSLVAIIALIASSIGFLGKSYADSIDEISGKKMEALEANGATPLQIFVHGIFPQFIPAWLNWTLFSFEINIRASSILGLVGAGGIGILIQTRINLFKYQEAAAIVLCVILLVLITEFGTNALRRKIR